MLAEIEKQLSEEFEKALFAATLKNLVDKTNPLRLNNYSYAMRELMRHILERLSPDKSILQCSWYKNETDKQDGVSRNQRACYAVQGGLSNEYVENTLGLKANDIHKTLIKAINRLSKLTHIEPHVFNLSETEVDGLVDETTVAIFEFLKTITDCRKLVIDRLWEHIDSAVIDEALKETINAIDELATHHYIDEIYTDKIEIFSISHESIIFKATGSIACELQWGSNSDLRRGDGAVLSETFKFSCELTSPVDEPEAVESVEDSLSVDTRSWHEARYGLDEIA